MFFFSSGRRHTRSYGDWSSDVCSSDLIDAAVMFASMFENLAMDPIVVLVPGHAYVGVRVAKNSERYLFIDAAMMGRSTFESAVRSEERRVGKENRSRR